MDLRLQGMDAIKEAMDTYSGGAGDYFAIANDGEVAKVRFCHGDDKDLDIYVVHKVKIAGKDKYIACLTPAKEPCALCQASFKPSVRIFLTLEDSRENGKRKVWDRGKTEIPNILGLVSRYGRLDSRFYEIQRHGKKSDKDTKYQFFPLDPIPNADLLTRDPVLAPNGLIMQCTPEEMRNLMSQISAPTTTFGAQPQTQGTQVGKMF